MPKLSVRMIENCPLGQTIWDTDPPGLGFRHQSGGTKVWVLRYTSPVSGQRRQTNLGYYSDHGMSLSAARDRAHETINDVRRGIDPLLAAKDAAKAVAMKIAASDEVFTINVLLDKWISEHVETRLKPNTQYMAKLFVNNQLRPHLGSVLVNDLDLPRLQREVDIMSHKFRGSSLFQSMKWLRAGWRWARPRFRDFPQWNPFDGISIPYRPKVRKRILSKSEYIRLWEVLLGQEPINVYPVTLRAIEFLIISGVRKNQALEIKWEHIKRDRGIIELPGKMHDEEDCVISEPIADFIENRSKETQSEWMFPSIFRPGKRAVNINDGWKKIRKMAGLNDVTIHDFRRSYISMSKAAGIAVEDASKVIGHADISTTQAVYYHLHPDDRKSAADSIALAVVSLKPKQIRTPSEKIHPPIREAIRILRNIRKTKITHHNFDRA